MRDRAFRLALLGRFDVALHAAQRGDPETAAHVRAYVDGARGAWDRALAGARPLARAATDPGIRARASLTVASVLRQTGRHAEAVPFDRRAFTLARDLDQRAHALIGLAADAVGAGDAAGCASWLAQAASCTRPEAWRAGVRLGWVVAEHRLLVDRPGEAIAPAAAAATIAARAGATRHEAKSLLFLGVAMRTAGEDGTGVLRAAEAMAVALGAAPIARVAARFRRTTAGQYDGRR